MHDYSDQGLQSLTNRLTNVLSKLNLNRGDGLFVLTRKIPELEYVLIVESKAGIKLSDTDYPKLSSLAGCITYFSHR